MTTPTRWTGVEPLPLGRTILLEASAGTGKTWQIEGLVARLVAQGEPGIDPVPIERILVITFTNAATAELRDRIRRRLVQARDALGSSVKPKGDPILELLWADADRRAQRRSLLATALSNFDLAPISTIHGFSQRMLAELAFQSGQEPGLELITDPAPILQQLVDDELARTYAEASEEELALLADMGWARDTLGKLAKAMTKAVAPVLEPTWPGVDQRIASPLEAVRAWLEAKNAFRTWLDSAQGLACVDAVRAELERTKGKRVGGRTLTRDAVGKRLDDVKHWLDGPALRLSPSDTSPLATAVRKLRLATLEEAWTGAADALTSFAGYPLFERFSHLLATQDSLWPQPLACFAARARARTESELVRKGQLTYSTMISRLAERIAEQARKEGQEGPLARAIRSRFDVALVDEFQDTDGAQWPVMRMVFAHPDRRLLLIGDPKQAIYAFRGADVHVYLDAARVADSCATMATNWRSDEAYVQAMNHLWAEGSHAFDLDQVDYVEVASADRKEPSRIRGLPAGKGHAARRALELRWVDGETLGTTSRTIGNKEVGQDLTARLAALEAARLLDGEAEILVAREEGAAPAWSKLRPGDIAVLVRTNDQAERVRRYLDRLGIPAVSAGRGSVLKSPVLGWLCAWLDAVAAPGRDRPARALATTPLFGWTASDLAQAIAAADRGIDAAPATDEAGTLGRWDAWLQSIQRWAQGWPTRGFVGVVERALDEFAVIRRLLGARQGERYATDLRHLIELCHAEERRTRLGPSGLASWLRASRDAASDDSDEAQALRLESDARAVQLVTVYKSKGLEYPVVLLPFAWADYQPSDKGFLTWHAKVAQQTELRLNLELPGTDHRSCAYEAAASELRQEQLRLLYVALTRARHHCVAWLGPLGSAGADTGAFALGRITLRERDATGRPIEGGQCPAFPAATRAKDPEKLKKHAADTKEAWQEIRTRLDRLAKTSGGTVGWAIEALPEDRAPLRLVVGDVGALQARPWPEGRSLVTPWQVSSYSAMVAGRTFDAAEPQRLDEVRATTEQSSELADGKGAQVELREPVVAAGALAAPIPTRELHGGTDVGTWTHAVLEQLDFQQCAGRDGTDLAALVADLGTRHGVRSPRQHELLAGALPAVLETPLDGARAGLPGGYRLRALPLADRRDELGFDLKLGAGNRWCSVPDGSAGRINQQGARLALESRLGDRAWGGDAWLRAILGRGAHEDRGVLPRIAGILTGFIDLTFRVEVPTEGGASQPRFFVADYKTNRIAAPSERRDSRRLHYTQPWMAWEMAHHGYHLQALLYTVALHRMLRQRVPNYGYETHIGGHFYLFLRGMLGPDTPRDAGQALGVYFDRWPESVVVGFDAALSGASTEEIRVMLAGRDPKGGGA